MDDCQTFLISDSEIYSAIADVIESTEKELIILSPWIYLTRHQRELLKLALSRSVNVTLLTRKPKPNDTKHSQEIETLQKMGVVIFFDNYLHAKLIIADRFAVIVMSSNIVFSSMTRNHEICIYSEDPDIVNEALSYIERLEVGLGISILEKSNALFEGKAKKVLGKIFRKMLKKQEEKEDQKEKENICPWCGRPLIVREGKYGRFLACTGYPDCKYTRNIEWKSKRDK